MSSPVFAHPAFSKEQGPSVSTSYGNGGVHTTMGREGIDIGLPPNFEEMFSRFRPPRAEQAAALRVQPQIQAQPQERAAPVRINTMDTRARPKDYGRYMMNQTGNWGTMVNAADLPEGSQIAPGFYGEVTNWDTSNPMILGHSAYGRNAPMAPGSLGSIGGSAGGEMSADQADALRGVNPNAGSSYLPGAEAQRWHDALTRSNAEIAARSGKG